MNKAERAVVALREAADALNALPAAFRYMSMIGPLNSPERMRQEADHIEKLIDALATAIAEDE